MAHLIIFGLPLIGNMFVPILSGLLLVLVASQFVIIKGKGQKAPLLIKPQQMPASEEKQKLTPAVSSESNSSSDEVDVPKKKKKKSCCGTKGACCKTKKNKSAENEEGHADGSEKKCGCSCGSKKESGASNSEVSDSENSHSDEILDVEDLAGLLGDESFAPQPAKRVNGVPVGRVRLRVKGRMLKNSPAAN